MKHDSQIIRSAKQLTQKECANYADGACVPEDCPCHLINPAYKTIHDGAIDCDWFVQVVLPLQPELLTAYWHEIFREEGQAGTGWKECPRCHKPFVPGSNRQQYCAECARANSKARNRERQCRYRKRQKDGSNVTL